MVGTAYNENGIHILEEWIPYEGIIKVLSDKPKTTHIIVFDLDGNERAFQVKMSPDEYKEFRKKCKTRNRAAYFQPYQVGEGLAAAMIACTLIAVTGLLAAIAGFKHSSALGYSLGAVALSAMIANIFIKRKISLMRNNQGDDPKKVAAARLANAAWRERS